MEEDRQSTRYWCHQCNLEVDTILEVESVKCSLCHGGFVEELDGITTDHRQETGSTDPISDLDPDRALSLWAPILLGMMNNPHRRRFRQLEFEDDEEDEDRHGSGDHRRRRHFFQRHREGGESELDHELEVFMRRRRRSSATILQLLQGVRAGMISESEERENGERVILINPFNQTIILSGGDGGGENPSQAHTVGSLGDYFVGPGLDQLLQQLAENDQTRYGTPPARKEAVESMPTVKIDEPSVQCSVCLDDFEVRSEAKEMPCKHRFHSECILPWLELHSSCPVCRFELPADESKLGQEPGRAGGGDASGSESEDVGNGNGRRFSVSLPWPFNSLFSGSQTGGLVSSTSGSGSGSDPSARAREPRAGEDGH